MRPDIRQGCADWFLVVVGIIALFVMLLMCLLDWGIFMSITGIVVIGCLGLFAAVCLYFGWPEKAEPVVDRLVKPGDPDW